MAVDYFMLSHVWSLGWHSPYLGAARTADTRVLVQPGGWVVEHPLSSFVAWPSVYPLFIGCGLLSSLFSCPLGILYPQDAMLTPLKLHKSSIKMLTR